MSLFAAIAECRYLKTGVLAGIEGVRTDYDLRFRAIRPGKLGFVESYLSAIPVCPLSWRLLHVDWRVLLVTNR